MGDVLQNLRVTVQWALSTVDLFTILDIGLVALVFYGLLYLIRGTQAVQLLRGTLLFILVIVLLSNVLQLRAFNWLIRNSVPALLIALPVIFQPELRRALERLGRAGRFFTPTTNETATPGVIQEISRSVSEMSARRHGALIVLERDTGLQDIADTGEKLDAAVSADLLMTIFFPKTALHDGAVIVRGNRIVAARAVLPLATGREPDQHLGTRHLAAIGLTERTDAIVVVVSEETGIISMVRNGIIRRRLDEGQVSRLLYRWLNPQTASAPDWFSRILRGAQNGKSGGGDEATPTEEEGAVDGAKLERQEG